VLDAEEGCPPLPIYVPCRPNLRLVRSTPQWFARGLDGASFVCTVSGASAHSIRAEKEGTLRWTPRRLLASRTAASHWPGAWSLLPRLAPCDIYLGVGPLARMSYSRRLLGLARCVIESGIKRSRRGALDISRSTTALIARRRGGGDERQVRRGASHPTIVRTRQGATCSVAMLR